MTQLTDAMTAAIATLQSQHGLSTDQVNAIVAQAIAPLQSAISSIQTSQATDEQKLADVTAALTEFTTAFAPAPTPAPAPTSSSSSGSGSIIA